MAQKQEADQEPSIEEILDSIRQIISDEEEEAAPAKAAPTPPPQAAAKNKFDDEIIELTNKLEQEKPLPAYAYEPPPEEPLRDPIEIDMRESVQKMEIPQAPPPKPAPPPPPKSLEPRPQNYDSILTDRAENAAMDAFSDLARRASVERTGGITIEDIVREELRPMLREWLDKNLPGMVEKLVQKELERISKQVAGD